MQATDASWLTIREAAGELRVSEATILRMVAAGELSVVRLGGGLPGGHRPVRISRRVLDEQMATWSERSR